MKLLKNLKSLIKKELSWKGSPTPNDPPLKTAYVDPHINLEIKDDDILQRIHESWDDENAWCSQRTNDVMSVMYGDSHISHVNHVRIHIHPFDGVGYTHDGKQKGSKEVHISSTYLHKIPHGRRLLELEGVMSHELVHAF